MIRGDATSLSTPASRTNMENSVQNSFRMTFGYVFVAGALVGGLCACGSVGGEQRIAPQGAGVGPSTASDSVSAKLHAPRPSPTFTVDHSFDQVADSLVDGRFAQRVQLEQGRVQLDVVPAALIPPETSAAAVTAVRVATHDLPSLQATTGLAYASVSDYGSQGQDGRIVPLINHKLCWVLTWHNVPDPGGPIGRPLTLSGAPAPSLIIPSALQAQSRKRDFLVLVDASSGEVLLEDNLPTVSASG